MKGDPILAERLERANKADVSVPQPVFAEIAYGLERLPRSKRRETLKHRFQLILSELARCPWSDEVSAQFGTVKAALERKGERIEDFDVAIAAHALAIGAVLVSANLSHLTRVPGLVVEDWARRG